MLIDNYMHLMSLCRLDITRVVLVPEMTYNVLSAKPLFHYCEFGNLQW